MAYPKTLACAAGDLNPGGADQPWSSPEQYVLFSSKLPHVRQWAEEHGIGCKSVLGCWEGVEEQSYLINARFWPELFASGLIDSEVCILHLGAWARGGRSATLVYADGHSEYPGQFVQTSKKYALKQQGWTFDPSESAYYIIDNTDWED